MDVRTRPIARVVALAGACLAAAAGCSSERQASSAPPASEVVAVAGSVGAAPSTTTASAGLDVDTVAMVGDSITVGSQDELADAFAGIGLADAEINAVSGRRMVENGSVPSGLDGIAEVLAEGPDPDLWVIALGSNDVANYDAEEYPAAIGELLAAIPSDAPLVWVDCYLRNYEDESEAFGTALREVLAERGNATVVDWASVAASDGVLSDNVHPSGFGRAEFARRVLAGVHAWTA
jgi:lysophospholipase L1-like esterase